MTWWHVALFWAAALVLAVIAWARLRAPRTTCRFCRRPLLAHETGQCDRCYRHHLS